MEEHEKKRAIGRYVVHEYTARRLVVEAQSTPLVAIGVMWGLALPMMLWIAPWRGGSRPWVTATAALVIAMISLLVARFVPKAERLTVDREAGEIRSERAYLLPPGTRGMQIPLAEVKEIRWRRRTWQDGPGVEATRWGVELLERGGQLWRLAEDPSEEPMQELARVMAEVAGRPLGGAHSKDAATD